SQENAACETEGQRHDERRRPLPERKQTSNRRSQRCCQSNKYQDSSHRHCEGRTCGRLRKIARTARVLSHYRRSDRGRLNIPETNDRACRFEGRPSRLSSYSRLGPLESSAARLRGCLTGGGAVGWPADVGYRADEKWPVRPLGKGARSIAEERRWLRAYFFRKASSRTICAPELGGVSSGDSLADSCGFSTLAGAGFAGAAFEIPASLDSS